MYREGGEENLDPKAQYDHTLGWVPNPGVRVIRGIQYTIIEGNIRSNGTTPSQSYQSNKTILAVGDSFTFGDEVNDHEAWPAQLEQLLSHHVINGGVFGYGLDQ